MSREDEPLMFARISGGLYPMNEAAEEAVRVLKQDEQVAVKISHRRNLERLKAYWSYLRRCVDATGCASSPKVLHNAIKIGLGNIDYVKLKEGKMVPIAGSISFPKMTETEFIKYFEAAQQWLAEEIGYAE